MELTYIIIFLCTISGVICHTGECFVGFLLSGLTIMILLIVIICLSVALYMVRNNITICGININKHAIYVPEEARPEAYETIKDDDSTRSIKSGIVDMNSSCEPQTPTRIEENKPPIIMKRPIGPVVDSIKKAQMDKIITDVLNRQQKSESATLRELDNLTKPKTLKVYDSEFTVRRNSVSLNHLDALANEELDEDFYANREAINEMKNKFMPANKSRSKEEIKKSTHLIPRIEIKPSTSHDSLQQKIQIDDSEHEVYDTLPEPVRCTSDIDIEGIIDNIHVYDMPPRRKENNQSRNLVISDSQYRLPISQRALRDQDDSYYVNASDVHK